MMLLPFGNVWFNFVPIINSEGKSWIVLIHHISKYNDCTIK